MIKNNFYPLRTIVGDSVSIFSIAEFPESNGPLKIETKVNKNLEETVANKWYPKFLPDIDKGGIRYKPMPGMATMPMPDSNLLNLDDRSEGAFINVIKNPSDLPFAASLPVASLFGYKDNSAVEMDFNVQLGAKSKINPLLSNTDKEYSFLIFLDRLALIGGICFQGYPFISSRLENTDNGMTVGNFGLPREIKLTPLPAMSRSEIKSMTGFQRSQFIDSEFTYVRQEIISHSGINYLTIDPVKTNAFILTLTDLPFIPKLIDLDKRSGNADDPLLVKGFKGFAIPYLYFFEYKEQTKRNARLHAGLLGVKPEYPHLPKVIIDKVEDEQEEIPLEEDILKRAFPEYEYYLFDSITPKTVTGIVVDNNGNPLAGVNITVKGTSNSTTTGADGSFTLALIKTTDVMVFSMVGYQSLEIVIGSTRDFGTINFFQADQHVVVPDLREEGWYAVFTAHSALEQRRKFYYTNEYLPYPQELTGLLDSFKRKDENEKAKWLRECFISDNLQPNEKVTVYLQQGEEMERCVAGLKALFLMIPDEEFTNKYLERLPNIFGIGNNDDELEDDERNFIEDALAMLFKIPPETNFCEKIMLRVFEIDPLEGVSPASVPLDSKYATLLASIEIDTFSEVIFSQLLKGIPFKKISTSKYFAIEFTNTGERNGQVALNSLQLMRSAHVSVQPRAAKTQQVKAMHYRLIGPELADDFSKLGNEGFNFSIDRVTAGQTKNVLYSAMSLLDLLHTGNARIQSNIRRRAAEFEMVENFREIPKKYEGEEQDYEIKKINDADDFTGPNFEKRETDNDNTAWRSIESGKDVNWSFNKGRPGDKIPGFLFESFSGTEIRSRTEQISTLGDALATEYNTLTQNIKDIVDGVLPNIIPANSIINVITASQNVFLNNTQTALWKPFEHFEFGNNIPPIDGIQTLNVPPYYLRNIKLLTSLLGLLNGVVNPPEDDAEPSSQQLAINVAAIDEVIAELSLINGLSVGYNFGGNAGVSLGPVNGGISGGYSFGINSNLTSSIRNSTTGSTGSIVLTGQETKNSVNRSKQVGYDNNRSYTESNESEQKRIVTRRELVNRDNERVRGAEVMWQDTIQDIITGSIPLNFTLPATATKMNFRTADDALRIRFNSGFSPSIQVDFWFELTEEIIRDDY